MQKQSISLQLAQRQSKQDQASLAGFSCSCGHDATWADGAHLHQVSDLVCKVVQKGPPCHASTVGSLELLALLLVQWHPARLI